MAGLNGLKPITTLRQLVKEVIPEIRRTGLAKGETFSKQVSGLGELRATMNEKNFLEIGIDNELVGGAKVHHEFFTTRRFGRGRLVHSNSIIASQQGNMYYCTDYRTSLFRKGSGATIYTSQGQYKAYGNKDGSVVNIAFQAIGDANGNLKEKRIISFDNLKDIVQRIVNNSAT